MSVPALVNPDTGEIIADVSTADDVALIVGLVEFQEMEAELKSRKREISDEIARRMDFQGRRSVSHSGLKLEVNAPTAKEWDLDRLRADLTDLVNEDVISPAKAAKCVKWTPSPVWAEIKTLLSDPRCSRLSHAFKEIPATRYVKVRRV